ncbi:UDP-Glc:alpha-D-GlcNAc-diphosphoundecaprenol beta-1,3-glucosyltransferase WfgD [compost metagenome]
MKNHQTEVSVIIPCYRCINTIERAVTSVANQTLRPAEIILIDDHSNDGTLDYLKSIQIKYPDGWIKIIAQPENKGPGSARNAGWEIAKHPYIAFLDSDDTWHPQKIEAQLTWMREHPEAALTGHASEILSNEIVPAAQTSPSTSESFHPITKIQLLLSNRFPTRSVMLKRDLPYRFLEGKRAAEDFLLWCEICAGGYKCFLSSHKLSYSFKDDFGAGGLTDKLWVMQRGELDSYSKLYQKRKINLIELAVFTGISFLKYLRRMTIVFTKGVTG